MCTHTVRMSLRLVGECFYPKEAWCRRTQVSDKGEADLPPFPRACAYSQGSFPVVGADACVRPAEMTAVFCPFRRIRIAHQRCVQVAAPYEARGHGTHGVTSRSAWFGMEKGKRGMPVLTWGRTTGPPGGKNFRLSPISGEFGLPTSGRTHRSTHTIQWAAWFSQPQRRLSANLKTTTGSNVTSLSCTDTGASCLPSRGVCVQDDEN